MYQNDIFYEIADKNALSLAIFVFTLPHPLSVFIS